jgi:hypothetical protein
MEEASMDAVDILKICLRRWYVMLPILIGAAGVSYQLVKSQETTYTAAASYGLVQPRLTSGPGTGERNPLGTDDSDLVGAALEAQLNSRATQEELGSENTRGWGPGEADNGSSYSVKIPMFETTYEVRAWGSDEQEVEAVVDRVLKAAPAIADELQSRAGAPAVVRYEPFVLAPTQVDELPATSTMKLVIAVMGVGGLVGAAWSIVADRLLRRRKRPAEPEDADDATPDEPRLAPVRSDEPEAPGTVARDATADAEDDEAERSRSVTVVKRPRSPKSGSATAPTTGASPLPDRRQQPLVRR